MLQMLGSQFLEVSGFKFAKLMKASDTRKVKSVELKRRRFFEYVPPVLFWLVVLAYVAFVCFAFSIMDTAADGLASVIGLCLVLLIGYGFCFGIIFWLIYGKKTDPYQSQNDRMRITKTAIKL